MQKHNKLIHFKGYEDLISRIDDWILEVNYKGVVYTPFLLENEQEVLKRYVGSQYFISTDGGYEDAEKQIVKIAEADYYSDEFPLLVLKGEYNSNFEQINHRDCLGALLSLGIDPSVIGDIIIEENIIYIIVNEKIADFIENNLKKIKRSKINFSLYDGKIHKNQQFETREVVVSSNRLDVIVAACIKKSRSKGKLLIEEGKVKVNHQLLEDVSYLCNNCCIISIRKFGRFKVLISDRRTKKDNLVITIDKYL